MKPKFLPVLEMCIEVGVQRGWDRAHKHNDRPDEAAITTAIEEAVAGEIFEWFDIEELQHD